LPSAAGTLGRGCPPGSTRCRPRASASPEPAPPALVGRGLPRRRPPLPGCPSENRTPRETVTARCEGRVRPKKDAGATEAVGRRRKRKGEDWECCLTDRALSCRPVKVPRRIGRTPVSRPGSPIPPCPAAGGWKPGQAERWPVSSNALLGSTSQYSAPRPKPAAGELTPAGQDRTNDAPAARPLGSHGLERRCAGLRRTSQPQRLLSVNHGPAPPAPAGRQGAQVRPSLPDCSTANENVKRGPDGSRRRHGTIGARPPLRYCGGSRAEDLRRA
jgi:hypothetical protein